jgi:hypothetical protein
LTVRGLPEVPGAAAGGTPASLDPRFARPRTLFFCIGAQKAGTSWLDRYLRDHPEICLPVQKELHYWTTVRQPGASHWWPRVTFELEKMERRGFVERLFRGPERRRRDRSWRLADAMYRDTAPGHWAYADTLFQVWRGQPVVGEITPDYAYLRAEVFAEMAALHPDVRFVYILRDPIDRLVSALKMSMRRAVRTDAPRIAARSFEDRLESAASDPEERNLELSRYDRTIRRLESVVAPERIGYFFYETIFAQPEVDRLADFLGVARRPGNFDKRVHAARGDEGALTPVMEARLAAVLAPTYAFVRARFGDRVPPQWRPVGQGPAWTGDDGVKGVSQG